MLIREATAKDDHAIGELLVRAFEDTYRVKMPEVRLSDGRRAALRAVADKRAVAKVWVAEDAGHVVGTITIWPAGAEGSEAFVPGAADLRHLAVDESVRRAGVSQQLMNEAERWAWSAGATAICLHVRRGVHGLARFYRRRGYVRTVEGDLDKLPDVFLEAYVLRRGLRVERVTEATPDVRALVTELERELAAEYPPEQRHGLPVEALFGSKVHFFVVSLEGETVGCGGVSLEPGLAELKRMYVRPEARGRGAAPALLNRIELEARDAGHQSLKLETGTRQAAAVAFYTRSGFVPCAAFGHYAKLPPAEIGSSLFFEKTL